MQTHPLIAHRGESYDAPENTLAAVNLAWQRGARAVEVDAHLTADGRICVIHDTNTLRTTGVKRVVSRTPLEELRKLDAGSYMGSEWAGEGIPTLEEVIATVPPEGKLIVEIKSHKSLLDRLLITSMDASIDSTQLEVIAFDYGTVVEAKRMLPKHRVLWLIELSRTWGNLFMPPNTDRIMERVQSGKLDGVNLEDSKALTKGVVKELKEANILVYVWTVNDPARARELFSYGVDFITTDRPHWMDIQLGSGQQ